MCEPFYMFAVSNSLTHLFSMVCYVADTDIPAQPAVPASSHAAAAGGAGGGGECSGTGGRGEGGGGGEAVL